MGAECTEHGRDPKLDFHGPCDEVSNHPDDRRKTESRRLEPHHRQDRHHAANERNAVQQAPDDTVALAATKVDQ